MPSGLRLLVVCCFVVPVAFGQKVKIDFDPDTDFSGIRRYQWRTHPVFEKNPEMRERYAVGTEIVLEAGNTQFLKKGLQSVDSSPDVFVTFFIVAHDAQRTTTTIEPSPWWGPYGSYGWYAAPVWTSTQTEFYKEGMLVMDIVDAKTSKMIWRAYCGDQVTDMRTRHKNINSCVRKSLDRFPPKSKK